MTGARYEAGTSPICGGAAPGSASLILTLCQLPCTRENSSVFCQRSERRRVAWDGRGGDHDAETDSGSSSSRTQTTWSSWTEISSSV